MVGVGRDMAADSGNGSELYAVIGQSPRHLDRNVTLVGRVVEGIELLSVFRAEPARSGFTRSPRKTFQSSRFGWRPISLRRSASISKRFAPTAPHSRSSLTSGA